MSYADFTLESAEKSLGVVTRIDDVIPTLEPMDVPGWLSEWIKQGRRVVSLSNEKSRSEVLVAPVLVAAAEAFPTDVALFSGQRLDVDPAQGLFGECDFILALTTPVPRLRAPVISLVEAKRADIELGLGQCIAQMVGARIFNERAGEPDRPVFGCVTTGDNWQFLKLVGPAVLMERRLFYLDQLGSILAAFRFILDQGANGPTSEMPS